MSDFEKGMIGVVLIAIALIAAFAFLNSHCIGGNYYGFRDFAECQ